MNILIIGCGKDQKKLINSARKNNFFVIGVDKNKKFRKNVDSFINISTYDTKKLISKLTKSKLIKPQAVISNSSSKSLITTVLVAKKYQLPNYSIKLAMCSLSKKKLFDFCLKNKIPSIRTEIYKPKNKYTKIQSKKIIIKPEQPLIGKKNVYLLDQNSKKNLIFIKRACKESLSNQAVVQPYIEGENLNLSLAVCNSKIIWFNFYEEKNLFKNKNLNSSKVRELSKHKYIFFERKALNIVKRIIKKNKITGFVNFSFRVNKNKIFLYELNPGLPGDQIVTKIFERSNKNVNFYLMDILLMSGLKPNVLKKRIGI